ncbi:unnamed protein product (mitochondrion) [Plasmodiophora brassicae]|uniref:Uncharacterized protein n=1 Tax=Plasmodiophora brassicae TaxID=37360 RepID=A0A3P3YHW3_PLABS|nr:unnamed protein product [Plasmodiophora brassicae]
MMAGDQVGEVRGRLRAMSSELGANQRTAEAHAATLARAEQAERELERIRRKMYQIVPDWKRLKEQAQAFAASEAAANERLRVLEEELAQLRYNHSTMNSSDGIAQSRSKVDRDEQIVDLSTQLSDAKCRIAELEAVNNALVKLTETSEAQSREHLAALKEQLNGLQKSYQMSDATKEAEVAKLKEALANNVSSVEPRGPSIRMDVSLVEFILSALEHEQSLSIAACRQSDADQETIQAMSHELEAIRLQYDRASTAIDVLSRRSCRRALATITCNAERGSGSRDMPLHERDEQSESVQFALHQRNAEITQLRREITHLTEKYDNVLEQLRDQHSYNWAIVRLFNELKEESREATEQKRTEEVREPPKPTDHGEQDLSTAAPGPAKPSSESRPNPSRWQTRLIDRLTKLFQRQLYDENGKPIPRADMSEETQFVYDPVLKKDHEVILLLGSALRDQVLALVPGMRCRMTFRVLLHHQLQRHCRLVMCLLPCLLPMRCLTCTRLSGCVSLAKMH